MESWNNRPVLVTGAGGFIGSHLVERLAVEGAQVKAFVRYNSRGDIALLRRLPSNLRSRIEIIAGDLRDLAAVRLAAKGCQVVFHLGALISIPYSYKHPVEVSETNFIGTLNVLMACREGGADRLVHTSTSEVYGTALQVPINEQHPLQGQSPYSASKIGADKLVESFYLSYELPVVTVRPFNTYGPRQSARAVIPAIITQALTQQTIRIGTMDTTRDFTYIDDTVRGLILAAQIPGIEGKIFNLGTGVETNISDLVPMVIERMGKQIAVEVDPARIRPPRSEVFRLVSDNSFARQYLGWQPEVDLGRGLDFTIEWIRANLDFYQVGIYEI